MPHCLSNSQSLHLLFIAIFLLIQTRRRELGEGERVLIAGVSRLTTYICAGLLTGLCQFLEASGVV